VVNNQLIVQCLSELETVEASIKILEVKTRELLDRMAQVGPLYGWDEKDITHLLWEETWEQMYYVEAYDLHDIISDFREDLTKYAANESLLEGLRGLIIELAEKTNKAIVAKIGTLKHLHSELDEKLNNV